MSEWGLVYITRSITGKKNSFGEELGRNKLFPDRTIVIFKTLGTSLNFIVRINRTRSRKLTDKQN